MKILQCMGYLNVGISREELTMLLKGLSRQQIEKLIKRTPEYEETINIIKNLGIKMIDNRRNLGNIDIEAGYFPYSDKDRRCVHIVHDTENCVYGHQRCRGKEACIKSHAKTYNVSEEYWKNALETLIQSRFGFFFK